MHIAELINRKIIILDAGISCKCCQCYDHKNDDTSRALIDSLFTSHHIGITDTDSCCQKNRKETIHAAIECIKLWYAEIGRFTSIADKYPTTSNGIIMIIPCLIAPSTQLFSILSVICISTFFIGSIFSTPYISCILPISYASYPNSFFHILVQVYFTTL